LCVRDALERIGVVEYVFTIQGFPKGGSISVMNVNDVFKKDFLDALESKYGADLQNPYILAPRLTVTWYIQDLTKIELESFGGQLLHSLEQFDPPEQPSVRVIYSDLKLLLKAAKEEKKPSP
jgi:hypothetical protein